MKLVVFDLDQTLIDIIPLHDEATKTIFCEFYGVEARLTEIDFSGKSLTENFNELGRLKGIPRDRLKEDAPRLLQEYEAIFAGSVPKDAGKYVLPGALELLAALGETNNYNVLYTGDSKGIVDTVFRATELGKYLKFAVYGTDAPTRAGMLRLAIEKASRATGKRFVGKDVAVIGDSLRDIQAGREVEALTIAVATGFHPKAMLQQSNPDFLLDNLKDTKAVLQAIG